MAEETRPVPPSLPAILSLKPEEEKQLADLFSAGTLPPVLEQAVEEYVSRKTGKDWHDPVVCERLRKAIAAQKGDYWKPSGKRKLHYTKGYSVLGYLAYHFPVYFMQTEHLLAMLARDGLLKKKMTILDIGTGPGVVPFAIADFLSRIDGVTADVFSIERSEEQIEAFLYLRDRFVPKGGRVSVKPPIPADITSFDPGKIPRAPDLITFSGILNELAGISIDERADLIMACARRLAPDGAILISEPAEEVVSTQLRVLSLALRKRGLTIHSPCSFIWGTNCTPDRCWSFVSPPAIRPTRLMKALAACDEPFRYINTDIKYSYVVLNNNGRTRETYRVPHGSRALRLLQVRHHVDKRINVIAAKMSENLGDAKNRIFRLCDGTTDRPVYAVIPSFHITPENAMIVTAPYGTILELNGVLVRYNRNHDADNLLVSRSTVIRTV